MGLRLEFGQHRPVAIADLYYQYLSRILQAFIDLNAISRITYPYSNTCYSITVVVNQKLVIVKQLWAELVKI